MVVFIIYVWILDLFLYSNTEIFLIFFIFLNFGLIIFNVIIWYYEYLDEWILSENRNLYTTIFILRKKFVSIRNQLLLLSKESAGSKDLSICPFGFALPVILDTANLAIVQYTYTRWYSNIFKYLNFILFQMYQFEMSKWRVGVFAEFESLSAGILDPLSSITEPQLDPVLYLFTNSIFNIVLVDFACYNYYESFFSCWVSNFPLCNYVEIYLKY